MTTGATRGGKWLRWVLGLAGGLILLWALLVPLDVTGTFNGRDRTMAMSDMWDIRSALWSYYEDHGKYPDGDNLAIYRELIGQGNNKKVYLNVWPGRIDKDGYLLDPWGTPIRIEIEGRKVIARSAAKDRRFSHDPGSDDIVVELVELTR